MSEKKPTRIIIPRTGIATGESGPRAVYDQTSSKVMAALGKTATMRASHVEPGSALSNDALVVLRDTKADCVSQGVFKPGGVGVVISPHYESWWFADMTPTGHNVVLGPYPPDQRDTALAEEVKWLHEHNIPVCGPCRESPTGRLPTQDPAPQFLRRKPNLQHLPEGAELPRFETAELTVELDFSGVEKRVLDHYRRQILDTMVGESFAGRTVEAVNGWEHDGEDTYETDVFLERFRGSSEQRHMVVVFEPNLCAIKDANCTAVE